MFLESAMLVDHVRSDDALSRRDTGLEFLDVTPQVRIAPAQSGSEGRETGRRRDTYRFTNISSSVVDTHLIVIVEGLDRGVRLANASCTTSSGDPYLRVYLPNGVLRSGESIARSLELIGRRDHGRARVTPETTVGTGQAMNPTLARGPCESTASACCQHRELATSRVLDVSKGPNQGPATSY